MPRTSRRTVFGPKTYRLPRIIVHLQFLWLSHAWRFILVVKKSLSGKCVCLVGNVCSKARSVVIGHDVMTTLEIWIVSSRRLSSPRNWSRTPSLVHLFPFPTNARHEQPTLVKGKPLFDIVKLIARTSTAANAAGTKHKIEPEKGLRGTRGVLRRVLGRPVHSQMAPTASQLQDSHCVRATDEHQYCDTSAGRATMNPK